MSFNKSENEAIIGTGLSNASRGMPADQSYGTLFEGIGNIAQTAMAAYDARQNEKINLQADATVEAVVQQNMPPELQDGINQMQNLSEAKRQGKISQVQFLTDLNVAAKRLRSQFPEGYGPQIEGAIQAAAGRSTANALREARLQAIASETASIDEAHKNMREYLESPENAKFLNMGTMKEMFKAKTGKTIEEFTNNPTLEDFNTLKYLRNEMAAVSTELDTLRDKAAIEDIYRAKEVETAVSTIYRNIFNDQINPKYGDYMKLRAKGLDPSGPGGKEFTPEELGELNSVWREFSFTAQQQLNDFIIQSGMKPEEADKFSKHMKDIMTLHAEYLTNQYWGINNAVAYNFKQKRDGLVRELIGRDNFFGAMNLLTQAGGTPDVVNAWLVRQPESTKGEAMDNLAAVAAMGILSGKNSVSDTIDKISEYEKNASLPTKATLEKLSAYMGSEVSTPETTAAAAVKLFSEKNNDMLMRLAEKDRIGVFENFMSPKVLEMLKASGNEDAMKYAMNWGSKQFEVISKPLRDNAFEGAAERIWIDVKYENGKFVINPRQRTWGEWATQVGVEGPSQEKVVKSVADLNRYIATMTPFWEATGQDAAMALAFRFEEINSVEKNGPLMQQLGKAVINAMSGNKEPEAGQQKLTPAAKPQPAADTMTTGSIAPAAVEKAAAVSANPTEAELEDLPSSKVLKTAAKQLGMNERDQNSALKEYLANGGVNLDPATTAWCAAYVNSTLAQNGLKGTGSNLARSFLAYGEEVSKPKEGDIVVFSRGKPGSGQGHVGFFKGYDDNGDILVLGGNQGDSVSVKSYSKNRLLGFRRIPGHNKDTNTDSLLASN